MRYPKDHGQQTRRRIVENASYGLRQNGADGLSVVDLMKLAGLTHGSFYVYFESRDALVVEALALAMDRTVARIAPRRSLEKSWATGTRKPSADLSVVTCQSRAGLVIANVER